MTHDRNIPSSLTLSDSLRRSDPGRPTDVAHRASESSSTAFGVQMTVGAEHVQAEQIAGVSMIPVLLSWATVG